MEAQDKGLFIPKAAAITTLWTLVLPSKSWPVGPVIKEATLLRALTCPPQGNRPYEACSPLQPISCPAPAATSQATVLILLFQSNHLTLDIPLWPLKLNCVMFSAFQIIYSLTMVHLSFLQWPSSQIIQ